MHPFWTFYVGIRNSQSAVRVSGMCQHGWGKFQREYAAAAALSYLHLAEDQRLDRERQICWKKKKVGNWRCGPALVLLFQAPHSPARNCAPYQIPTNCWVSQKHHHHQRASALATDMVSFSFLPSWQQTWWTSPLLWFQQFFLFSFRRDW